MGHYHTLGYMHVGSPLGLFPFLREKYHLFLRIWSYEKSIIYFTRVIPDIDIYMVFFPFHMSCH